MPKMYVNLNCMKRGGIARWRGFDVPTMPKTAVKRSLMKALAKLDMLVEQPRRRVAAAGLGQTESVTKAGDVLLR